MAPTNTSIQKLMELIAKSEISQFEFQSQLQRNMTLQRELQSQVTCSLAVLTLVVTDLTATVASSLPLPRANVNKIVQPPPHMQISVEHIHVDEPCSEVQVDNDKENELVLTQTSDELPLYEDPFSVFCEPIIDSLGDICYYMEHFEISVSLSSKASAVPHHIPKPFGPSPMVYSLEDGPTHVVWKSIGVPVTILQNRNMSENVVDWLKYASRSSSS